MLVGPAIHQPVSQPGGDAQRGHSLDRAHLLFRQRPACRPECVAEAAVVQASGSVASQRAVEATLALDLRELHSEVLHYVPLRGICQTTSSASPQPTLPRKRGRETHERRSLCRCWGATAAMRRKKSAIRSSCSSE